MITVISYVALRFWFGDDWSGWLLVLPVLLDLAIITKFAKECER